MSEPSGEAKNLWKLVITTYGPKEKAMQFIDTALLRAKNEARESLAKSFDEDMSQRWTSDDVAAFIRSTKEPE